MSIMLQKRNEILMKNIAHATQWISKQCIAVIQANGVKGMVLNRVESRNFMQARQRNVYFLEPLF